MEKRFFLAIVLSVIVVVTYQFFFAPKPPERKMPRETASSEVAPVSPAPAAPSRASIFPPATTPRVAGTEKDVTVDTPLYKAVFTTKGGALRSFKLKNFKVDLEPDSEPIELVHVFDSPQLPLALSFMDSTVPLSPDDLYHTDMLSLTLTETDQPRELVFSQSYGTLRVEKIFIFDPTNYTIQMDVKVKNLSVDTIQQTPSLAWFQYDDPAAAKSSSLFSFLQPFAATNKGAPVHFAAQSVTRSNPEDIKQIEHYGPNISWAGYENKYFLAAMIPQKPVLTSLTIGKDDARLVSVQMKGPKNLIPANDTGTFSYTLYLGPKDYTIMKSLDVDLENAIDFGSWVKWLSIPLLHVLKFIYQYVHNYGIAIIILTILIKIIFWPLGNKSYKSMKAMQKLQPKMMAIREKYKDDKQRLSQEMMNFYKSNKFNPLGGCLPMLVQLPVFVGLYYLLFYAIELRHSPFFFWIQDLSARDPYYITPLLMGASFFLQQKMMPVGDPTQAKIMLFLPVVFTMMFLSFPSGLVIYWLLNNLISIGQQLYINKYSS